MLDQVRPYPGRATVGFAALAVGTSLFMTASTLLARTGLGFPLPLLVSAIAVVALSTFVPALWASRSAERQVWVGPLSATLLVASCVVLGALGLIGTVLIYLLALGCLLYSEWRAADDAVRPSPGILLSGCVFALIGALLYSVDLGGTKYVNFLLDQLLLQGRADGDNYLNAALTQSLNSFLFPAAGIDGLAPARYHFGFYALAAAFTDLAGGDAALAMIGLQMIVLVPLLGFALAHGALVIGTRLVPDRPPPALILSVLAFVLVPLVQLSGAGNLIAHSTSMLIGGVLLTLFSPSFLAQVPAEPLAKEERAGRIWWLAALAIPVLSVAKVSVGYVWTAVAGYLALRKMGLRRVSLWALGLAMGILFFGGLYLLAPTGGGGGKLFGTPYYVERGFAEGKYLLPLQMQWQSLAALAGLFLLRFFAVDAVRKLLVEALIIAIVAANLPGLLMEIAGGDAAYFLVAGEWFALPILLATLAAVPGALAAASRNWRIAGCVAGAVAAAGLILALIDAVPLRAYTFVSAEALVHTGDRSYFLDHRKRALKADTNRATEEQSVLSLMQLAPAEPAGLALARELRAVGGSQATGVIAFAAPDADFWKLFGECDGSSLWPMAVAGVSMLGGQTTSRMRCPEHPILGEGLPDMPLSSAPAPAELCALAAQRGFKSILVIDSLDQAPERIECDVAVSGLGGS